MSTTGSRLQSRRHGIVSGLLDANTRAFLAQAHNVEPRSPLSAERKLHEQYKHLINGDSGDGVIEVDLLMGADRLFHNVNVNNEVDHNSRYDVDLRPRRGIVEGLMDERTLSYINEMRMNSNNNSYGEASTVSNNNNGSVVGISRLNARRGAIVESTLDDVTKEFFKTVAVAHS